MMDADPYRLHRFIEAQNSGQTYQLALAELRAGRKVSHWMWFVFPQVAGLGHSAMSRRFAIESADEARAYVAHPVLGARLIECAEAVAAHRERTAEQILGGIDAQKLHSSMTLFQQVAGDQPVFATVLDRFFGGRLDQATIELLRTAPGSLG